MNPTISICIPVYNVELYIEKCISSVLEQSFQNFEIIIVNDATQDNSMVIVTSLFGKDSRVRIFNNERNMGLMWTRREGYRQAKGDYVVFLDSDDILPKDSLYNLYNAIMTSEADIVCGQIAYITSEGVSLDKYPNQLLYGCDSESAIKSTLRWEITHNLCGKIYKRELLQSYSYDTYENVINAEDALLFYQILSNTNSIATTSEVVYNYYLYENSSSNVVLGEKALRGIFLWQAHRYNIISGNYPALLKDLYASMVSYLTSLTPSISSRKKINEYLSNYKIPFELNFNSIIKYAPYGRIFKSLISYYCSSWVKQWRYYRLRKGGIKGEM